jgi:putative ABC transport system ATP-binding protein
VIADEPTAHLDQANLEGVLRLLRRLTADGRVVVVSTHDERLLPLADQVVELAPRIAPVEAGPVHVTLADGEVLFDEGDRSDHVYTVVSGAVDITRRRAGGGDEVLRTVDAGEWFGEMGPLFQLPRSAAARAVGPTVVEGCTVHEFRDRLGVETLAALLAAASA